jgi:ATP-binding cassette, subfamily B, bacterial MsbA
MESGPFAPKTVATHYGHRMPDTLLPSAYFSTGSATALIWRLLTEYGFARWPRYAVAFTLTAIAAGCTALSAYLAGDVVNQAFVNHDFAAVLRVSALVLAAFILRGAATYGHAVMLAWIGNSIVAENQRRLFAKLLHQNIGFFSDRHSSELLARLSTGAASANEALSLLITSVGRDFLTLLGLITVMVMQDPLMSIATFVIAPPIILVLRKLTRRVRSVAYNRWAGGARIMETLQETVQGIRIVKSFTLEDRMRKRFDENVAAVEYESNKLARVGQRANPLMETLAGVAISLAMVYAGYRGIKTGALPGDFFSFMTAFLLAYEPAKRLTRLNIEINAALVGVRVLFEIIDSPATEPPDEKRPALTVTKAHIAFHGVYFGYRPETGVLHDLSFSAEPGQTTALVGPSGAGKSTIFNLLLRFFDVDSGVITIDGQNIASVSRHSLRSHIAYVGQDVFLFRASIRDNIGFGRPDATNADIIAAARAAHAHDFILGFPEGYDTLVGERGLQLSGGERQRIAIARALIKNAPIILLDEATAALDSESEQQVQQAISELCKGRTTIVIAHRLSTVMHADQILVIEAGRIVESGVHDELLHKNGRYASFYRMQLMHQETPKPVAVGSNG